MAADLNLALRLKLADEASKPAEAALRRLGSSQRDMQFAEDRSGRAARRRAVAMKGAAIGVAAAGAGLIASVKWAIEFEEKMAGVGKVLDMSREGVAQLGDDISALSRKIPMAAEGLAEIVAMAAQAGVVDSALPDDQERAQLLRFAEDAAKMAVAFEVTAEQAADAMVKMRNHLGLTQPEVIELGDAINYVGNKSGAGADKILGVIERVGALGDLAGVSQNDLAALAATFVETSSSVEIAGTGFKNFLDALTAGEAATDIQLEIFEKLGLEAVEMAEKMQVDAKGAIVEVMEALEQLDAAERPAALRQLFGKESIESIGPLLNRLDILRENFELVSDSATFTGSMLVEYERQIETTASQWIMVQNNVKDFGRNVGNILLPGINKALVSLLEFMDRTRNIGAPLRESVDAFVAKFEGLSLYEAGVKLMESLGRGMWSVLTRIVDEIEAKLAGLAPDWMRRAWNGEGPASQGSGPGVGGTALPRSMRALGGPVRAGIAYQWQEEGRELFVPAVEGRVMSNREVRHMEDRGSAAAGSRNVTFNQSFTIHAPAGMSPRDIARAIDDRFRRAAQDSSLALHDGNLHA